MRAEKLAGRILLDTNVLIYATLAADPRHARAGEILALRQRPGIELFVSVQNLAEMNPNLTGPKNQPPDSPELAREKIRSIARLRGLTVLPLTLETLHLALDLCVEGGITRQRSFGSQLAALMIREAIPTILTENVATSSKSKAFHRSIPLPEVNQFISRITSRFRKAVVGKRQRRFIFERDGTRFYILFHSDGSVPSMMWTPWR